MKKWQIYIWVALVMIAVVGALQDCKGVMKTGDIPCLVISGYQYLAQCNSTTVNIYNQTPTLLQTPIMGDYGATGRCNITFNETKIGSYLLNFSSGESAKINVEGDGNMMLGIIILMVAITFIFAMFAVKFKSLPVQIGLSLLTLVMVVSDFFVMSKIIEITDPTQLGLIGYMETFYNISITIMKFAVWGILIFILWYIYKLLKDIPNMKRQKREEEYLYQ